MPRSTAIHGLMLVLLLAAATPRPALGQDPGGQDRSEPQRTALTKENLPGVYRIAVAIYMVTLTVRPDGTFAYESPEAKGRPTQGTWTLEQGRFLGRCQLEGGEEATLEIDLKASTLEDIEKGARVTVSSSRLGRRPVPVLVTKTGPCPEGGDQSLARNKDGKAPALGPLEELRGLADALAGSCSEAAREVCRSLEEAGESAKGFYRGLRLDEKVPQGLESLRRKSEEVLPTKKDLEGLKGRADQLFEGLRDLWRGK